MINIITRCTRCDNLLSISETVFTSLFDINWYVLFDTNRISDIDIKILKKLTDLGVHIKYLEGDSIGLGMNMVNQILDEITDGWVYILDDDNIIHPNFYNKLDELIDEDTYSIFVFDQKVGGKDFSGLDIREARPENTKVGSIDSAQFLIHIGHYGDTKRFNNTYTADGELIEQLYNTRSEEFIFINQELCYYNYFNLVNKNDYCLPRILLIGEEEIEMHSDNIYYESNELVVKCVKDESNLDYILQTFNPNSIVTIGKSFMDFPIMASKNFDIRRKWFHLEELQQNIGDIAYKVASNSILTTSNENNKLVSFFTSAYNTGNRLWRAYESLRNQKYDNWEWVIVNDSSDGGNTLLIAQSIEKIDFRVKLYDFRKKSKGVIGEAKYRAASLCSGDYLVEFDHDDYILPEATYWVVEAFKKYPDAKFVYSDCAEVYEGGNNCIVYEKGFCFGYGSYRDEMFNGLEYKTMNTPNINPKTIRHIVGVPNHFRCWDRKFYHSIGGHNRNLTIADDYELIVRTFLKTRMVRIPKLLYLQYYHSNNTQNKTRADIQRRVRSIREYYNNAINRRFLELGVKDWAFDSNPNEPTCVDSKFGNEESVVNYTFSEQDIQKNSYGLSYIL